MVAGAVFALDLAFDLLGGFLVVLAEAGLKPELDVNILGVDLL
jgi:hypothetical protein